VVGEFSLPGITGCASWAAQKVGEILAGIQIPEQVLVEAVNAVTRAIETALSSLPVDQAQPALAIQIRVQATESSATSAQIPGGLATPRRQGGWGLFLTGQTMTQAGSRDDALQVAVSLYLYHEGQPA
jgi:hypothetical protein